MGAHNSVFWVLPFTLQSEVQVCWVYEFSRGEVAMLGLWVN
jgi:hypothetical protein